MSEGRTSSSSEGRLPLLSAAVLFRLPMGWMSPATLVRLVFLTPPIQMLISSGNTLQTHSELLFYWLSRHPLGPWSWHINVCFFTTKLQAPFCNNATYE